MDEVVSIRMLSSIVFLLFLFVFFFKQKTADEVRISDWSSDVCSSDLRFTCLPRIVRPQDALDRQWPAPAGGEPLHVLPRQGSVELAVHIIVQRDRKSVV